MSMMRYRLGGGSAPLHHQVYADLRAKIDDGLWQPGDRLPPERELVDRYGCSLITIRRAMTELARESRVQRARGRGTFVTRRPIDFPLLGTMSFTEEMLRRGHIPTTRLIGARTAPADERVARALDVAKGDQTVDLERLRIVDGVAVLLERVHLSAARFPGLLDEDLEAGSLYAVLASRYDTHVVRAREWIEPVLLPPREAGLLETGVQALGLLIEGIAYDDRGEPIEYGRSWVRGDRTRTYLERDVARSAWPEEGLVPVATRTDMERQPVRSNRNGGDR